MLNVINTKDWQIKIDSGSWVLIGTPLSKLFEVVMILGSRMHIQNIKVMLQL
jgi:hypothetical protein